MILLISFATRIKDTCGKFTASVVDNGGKLPLVLFTLHGGKFATSINTTSGTRGKCTAGVVDTGGAP